MFINQNSNKFKIIQFKDVVSLLLIAIILCSTLTASFASSYFTQNSFLNFFYKDINTKTDINARKLAMFSAIAYVDLEKIDKKYSPNTDSKMKNLTFKEQNMVTDAQLKKVNVDTTLFTMELSTNNKKDAYNFFFNNLGSTSEIKDWKIVNYTKITSLIFKKVQFAAVTFKKGNDIVVAFRGPSSSGTNALSCFDTLYNDFDELAKIYVKKVAQKYDGNFHLTGWSLGGYIAQRVGGYSLTDRIFSKRWMSTPLIPLVWGKKDCLKEVVSFNSPGFGFLEDLQSIKDQLMPTISSKITAQIQEQYSLSKLIPASYIESVLPDIIKKYFPQINLINLINLNTDSYGPNTEQLYYKKLQESSKNFVVNVANFKTKGDLVSQLGKQIDKDNGKAYTLCIKENGGYNEKNYLNSSYSNTFNFEILYNKLKLDIYIDYFDIIKEASEGKLDIKDDITSYKIKTLNQFITLTHRLDSFLGNLPYEDNSILPDISNISFSSVPENIKKGKTYSLYLNIETQNCELKTTTLSSSNFEISNLKITNISLVNHTTKKVSDVTYNTYKFKIKIKIEGSPTINFGLITLKDNLGIKAIKTLNNTASKTNSYNYVLNNLKTYKISEIISFT